MEYRKEYDLDHIIQDFDLDCKDELIKYFPQGYYGVDKLWRPVYISRLGHVNPAKVWGLVTEDLYLKWFIQGYEIT